MIKHIRYASKLQLQIQFSSKHLLFTRRFLTTVFLCSSPLSTSANKNTDTTNVNISSHSLSSKPHNKNSDESNDDGETGDQNPTERNPRMQELVNYLLQAGTITNPQVANIMSQVDRADFTPKKPYADHPQKIGYGATISAPHMHAHSLELLFDKLKPGMTVLDVGSGSGYLSVAMALMVGDQGKVVGIEHMKELHQLGIKNTNKHHSSLLKNRNLIYVVGDGRTGCPEEGPYDCIHVGAATTPQVCDDLAKQLKPGGKMVVPVEMSFVYRRQVFRIYTKDMQGNVEHKDLMGVRYIPLTSENSQRGTF